jgi:hypothetical protein
MPFELIAQILNLVKGVALNTEVKNSPYGEFS